MPKERPWSSMFQLETAESTAETTETNETKEVETTTKTSDDLPEGSLIPKAPVIEERDEDSEEEEQEITEITPTTIEGKVEKKEPEVKDENLGVFSPFMGLINSGILTYDSEKEYDNSEDGIKELIQDNITSGVEAWKNQYSKEQLEILDYLKNGGRIQEFIPETHDEPDYEKDVDLTNEDHQKYIIQDWLTEQGFEEEEIEKKIAKYEEAGLIEDEAKTAHKRLVNIQKKRIELKIEEDKKARETQKLNAQAKAEEFKKKVLGVTKIAGFDLKPGEAEKLYNYMSKPIKDGKTGLQLEYDEESQLKFAYLQMRKFEFKDLETKAETKNTIKLKKILNQGTDPNLKTKGSVGAREEEEDSSSTNIPGLPWQSGPKIRKK